MVCQKTNDVGVLEAHVRQRVLGQVSDLRVQVLDHGIMLRGWTRSFYIKQLAQHAIFEASQLPLVGNEIEVASAF
jgi:hypothetical protein